METRQRIEFIAPRELAQQYQQAALRRGISVGSLIKLALHSYLKREDELIPIYPLEVTDE